MAILKTNKNNQKVFQSTLNLPVSPDMSGENVKCPAKGKMFGKDISIVCLNVRNVRRMFSFSPDKMSGEGFMVRRSKCPAKLKII